MCIRDSSKALLLFQVLEQLHTVLAGGVQVQHRLVLVLLPGAQVTHHFIDPAGTQAAAEGKDDRAVPCPQLGADGVAVLCLGEHLSLIHI